MSAWHAYRIRVYTALASVIMWVAPRKYRMWIEHVMSVGVQKAGGDMDPHGVVIYKGGGEPVLFEFATRAEARAFCRGYEAGSSATPEDLRRTAELQASIDKPANTAN